MTQSTFPTTATGHLCAMSPHHLPAGEVGLPVLDTVEAKRIGADWMSPRQEALAAFATCGYLDLDRLADVVREVRAMLGEHRGPHGEAYGLRLLLVHVQGLCETRGIEHDQGEPFWCWCQPYIAPARMAMAA